MSDWVTVSSMGASGRREPNLEALDLDDVLNIVEDGGRSIVLFRDPQRERMFIEQDPDAVIAELYKRRAGQW